MIALCGTLPGLQSQPSDARRRGNNLTQRELSELANVGLRLVSELERGKPTLRTDAVNRVLAVFGQMLGVVPAPGPPFQVDDIP